MHQISRRLSFSHSSLSKYNRAFAGASHLARGPNIWSQRRNSGAASSAVAASDDVSSNTPKRTKKKVSKAERKSLLESFVNNYRATNSGKFPSASEVKKEVGGCFYVARKVIQEMEYETRMSLKTEVKDKKKQLKVTNTVEKVKPLEADVPLRGHEFLGAELPLNDVLGVTVLEGKEVAKKINVSNEKDSVSSCRMINEEIDKPVGISDSNNVSSIDADEKPFKWDASVSDQNNFPCENVSASATDDAADLITCKTDLSNEEPKVVLPVPEIAEAMKETTITVDDRLESHKMEEPARDISKEHSDNVESAKKSFAWNLKSLADGIINFWRKL